MPSILGEDRVWAITSVVADPEIFEGIAYSTTSTPPSIKPASTVRRFSTLSGSSTRKTRQHTTSICSSSSAIRYSSPPSRKRTQRQSRSISHRTVSTTSRRLRRSTARPNMSPSRTSVSPRSRSTSAAAPCSRSARWVR